MLPSGNKATESNSVEAITNAGYPYQYYYSATKRDTAV
jgi:hypothetical protein